MTPTSTPDASPEPEPDRQQHAETLSSVLSLASLFNTCVETFGLIHPTRVSDQQQRVVLTQLGIQQARLLAFGSIVGISSPPATIATCMVPSHAIDAEPIYFDPRDPRLEDPKWRGLVKATLDEIVERPSHLSREQMMDTYGLKPHRRSNCACQPILDTTRFESLYEKYTLLEELNDTHHDGRPALSRVQSITSIPWQIHDVAKFSSFVTTVRQSIDNLIDHFQCAARVDLGIKSDIKALGWHPETPLAMIRGDAEKLKLIAAACKDDYPVYATAAAFAMDHIRRELAESGLGANKTPAAVVVAPENVVAAVKQESTSSRLDIIKKSSKGRSRSPSPFRANGSIANLASDFRNAFKTGFLEPRAEKAG